MPAKKLSDAEISALLPKAKGWSVANGKLHREFACKDFVTAFGNMTRVALVAEAMNHHPEWFNVWNRVVIDLNTHSVKGISDYDFVLAEKINEIFESFSSNARRHFTHLLFTTEGPVIYGAITYLEVRPSAAWSAVSTNESIVLAWAPSVDDCQSLPLQSVNSRSDNVAVRCLALDCETRFH